MHRVSVFRNVIVNIILALGVTVLYLGTVSSALSVAAANVNPAYYEGNREGKSVALMINVYWGDEYLDGILKTLKDYDARVTFFVGGMWAEKNKDRLNEFVSSGHEIGNHGYLHKDSDKLSEKRLTDEITLCHKMVKGLSGVEMTLFAPPSGAYDNQTLRIAESLNYKTVMWTRDTIDWRDKDENLVYKRAVKDLKGGDLILMHPTAHTLAALPRILKEISEKGLVADTVSKTLA